jgi:hypothetical protein
MQRDGSAGNPGEAVTPRWQRVLAAISLAVVNVVVLPVTLALLLVWAVVLAIAGGTAPGSCRFVAPAVIRILVVTTLGIVGQRSSWLLEPGMPLQRFHAP